jgi:lipoprotein-anchoring transpeptidase ErfK/SrfK
VLETKAAGGQRWLRIGEAEWVKARDVRAATPAPVPEGLRPGERWIDVEIESQVLTAYEGERPVFATLVSTGKGRGTHVQATPKGARRIWVKLVSHDMDNLEDEDASRYYAMQAVPWVMFFDRGYGLHGTFWHRSFGNVRSHGCVNLSPRDAEWLFRWTGPRLPAGWTAALPTDTDPGTLVRVR